MFLKRLLSLFLFSFVFFNLAAGRVIVDNYNYSTAFSKGDVCYIIKGIVDLGGGIIRMPDGCTLSFQKNGRLVNGRIVGSNTRLRGLRTGSLGVSLSGTWLLSKIEDKVFDSRLLTDTQILDNISAMQSDDTKNTIILRKQMYSVELTENHNNALLLKSNTILTSVSNITVERNDLISYSVIKIGSASNVKIFGGSITGDVGNHSYRKGTSSEWGFGISMGGACNVLICGVSISRCTGDGIYIGGGKGCYIGDYTNASKNITLKNVLTDGNRRQGISITCADGVTMKNCSMTNTGKFELTSPGCGLDIEPNEGQSIRSVSVSGCEFLNNGTIMDVSVGGYVAEGDRCNIEKISFKNCVFSGKLSVRSGSVVVSNCTMSTLSLHLAKMPKAKVLLEYCSIIGGSGVVVRSTGRTIDNENEPIYVFKGCTIGMDEALTPALFSTINYKGNEVASFVLENCDFTFPRSAKRFEMVQLKNNTCSFSFSKCVIDPKGQMLDLKNIMYSNCHLIKDKLR